MSKLRDGLKLLAKDQAAITASLARVEAGLELIFPGWRKWFTGYE